MITLIIDYLSKGIAVCSLIIIVYGAILAMISFIRNEFKGATKSSGIRKIRADFGGYLLFGLELLIGADILKTVAEPNYQDLIILAGIVILRTVLSVFLNREIKDLQEAKD
ncbi:DUF1622 domain-containing protein [Bacteroidales bacterium OttesenSCG-928-C19]|nr:DUF1622 domain-containing protein [Bacteroidales bacterium OttesenSCG-928-C19]